MVVHGTWDAVMALGDNRESVMIGLDLLITATSTAVLFLALRWGAHRERGYLRAVLAPEVAAGTITDVELTALTGERSHRRRDRRAALRARDEGTSRHVERLVLASSFSTASRLRAQRGRGRRRGRTLAAVSALPRGSTTAERCQSSMTSSPCSRSRARLDSIWSSTSGA